QLVYPPWWSTMPTSLDALARDPSFASRLSVLERQQVVLRCAAVLAAVGSVPDEAPRTAPHDRDEDGVALLSVPQVAQELECSDSFVWQAIAAKRLRSVTVGRLRRVRANDLADFLRE